MSRPPIPRPLERQVLIEAGHRCAIPTCKQPTTVIAHIVPWVQVKEHTFDNLIALCPNCHTRYDKGEIDRKAMRMYKRNLSILNGRYGELEQRVLRWAAVNPGRDLPLPHGHELLLWHLVTDGLLKDVTPEYRRVFATPGQVSYVEWRVTEKGREFIDKWFSAEELD